MIPHFVLSGNVIDRNKAETTEDQQGGCFSDAIPFCACLPDIVSRDTNLIDTDRRSRRNQDAFRSCCSHPEPYTVFVNTSHHGIFLLTHGGSQTQPSETLQCSNTHYQEGEWCRVSTQHQQQDRPDETTLHSSSFDPIFVSLEECIPHRASSILVRRLGGVWCCTHSPTGHHLHRSL